MVLFGKNHVSVILPNRSYSSTGKQPNPIGRLEDLPCKSVDETGMMLVSGHLHLL